jgi:hypothetical protein
VRRGGVAKRAMGLRRGVRRPRPPISLSISHQIHEPGRSSDFKAHVLLFAVGTAITDRPPHRSVRAEFPHTAPTSGV